MKSHTPIVVFGVNRNGTTNLCNNIVRSCQVSALVHPLHYGNLEVQPHAMKTYFGEFQNSVDRIRFLAEYAQSDEFKVSGLSTEDFLRSNAVDFYDFLFDMMDAVATNDGNDYWLVKADPYLLLNQQEWKAFRFKLEQRYKKYHVLSVQRDFSDYMNSQMARKSSGGFQGLINKIKAKALYHHFYGTVAKIDDFIKLSFDEVVHSPEVTMQKLAEQTGVPRRRKSQVEGPEFAINTSFQKRKETKKVYQKGLVSLPAVSAYLCRLMLLPHTKGRYKKRPKFWYRLTRKQVDPEGLREELTKEGDIRLIKELDEK